MLKQAINNKRSDIHGIMLMASITASVFLLFICSFAESFERKNSTSLLHVIASATDMPAIRMNQRQETPAAKSSSRLLSTKFFNSNIKFERFTSDDNVINTIESSLLYAEKHQLSGHNTLSRHRSVKLGSEQARAPPFA